MYRVLRHSGIENSGWNTVYEGDKRDMAADKYMSLSSNIKRGGVAFVQDPGDVIARVIIHEPGTPPVLT